MTASRYHSVLVCMDPVIGVSLIANVAIVMIDRDNGTDLCETQPTAKLYTVDDQH